ncbi:hypothetical protein GOODEAATRI_018437 [Goodea atripinnis]|uniref:Uncharacterized protein n=1 Tax=Goodea atripinnis TaxID=208336 RepID=A0ABV0N2F8_9TELE
MWAAGSTSKPAPARYQLSFKTNMNKYCMDETVSSIHGVLQNGSPGFLRVLDLNQLFCTSVSLLVPERISATSSPLLHKEELRHLHLPEVLQQAAVCNPQLRPGFREPGQGDRSGLQPQLGLL